MRRVIKINNLEFKLKIEYSRSKYTYVKLYGDTIIIKTPSNNVDDLLSVLIKRLEKLRLDLLPKYAFNEFLIFGFPYKLYIKDMKRKYLIFHKRRLIILNPNYKREFIKYLANLLIKYSSKKIEKFLKLLNINIIPEIEIKIMKSKYAYLKENKLYMSLINVFFPKHLIDYILIHECIHFKVKDHGFKFKKLLSMIHPYHKEAEEELKRWTIAIFYNKKINELIK